MTYKVQTMGRTWLQIFFFYSVLSSYAELPLALKAVLCVDQKGKLLPSYGYCDIQLRILQLLSVLKLTGVSHFHQADLYLHFVVTILAFLFNFY